jgi:hypothetical protein
VFISINLVPTVQERSAVLEVHRGMRATVTPCSSMCSTQVFGGIAPCRAFYLTLRWPSATGALPRRYHECFCADPVRNRSREGERVSFRSRAQSRCCGGRAVVYCSRRTAGRSILISSGRTARVPERASGTSRNGRRASSSRGTTRRSHSSDCPSRKRSQGRHRGTRFQPATRLAPAERGVSRGKRSATRSLARSDRAVERCSKRCARQETETCGVERLSAVRTFARTPTATTSHARRDQ